VLGFVLVCGLLVDDPLTLGLFFVAAGLLVETLGFAETLGLADTAPPFASAAPEHATITNVSKNNIVIVILNHL
jgi:hypothetical protein